MKIAVQGLGRMGMQIARKLSEDGHTVLAHNRSRDKIDEAVGYGAVAALEKNDVISAFEGQPIVVWVMLPAEIIDTQIDEWLSISPKGSIIIDGGNSDYRLTAKRSERVVAASSQLIDAGTSGGVWGYDNGFSIMIGGDAATYEHIKPLFDSLIKPEGDYHHFGSSGAGHFVKMTHNAIEYGMMQSLAEGYRLLYEGPYKELDLAAAGRVWQHHSVVTSWLNDLSHQALTDNPTLEGVDGYVAESGEARWAIETANSLQIPMPSIEAAFEVRLASQQGQTNFSTKLLAAMRNKFGGHDVNKPQI